MTGTTRSSVASRPRVAEVRHWRAWKRFVLPTPVGKKLATELAGEDVWHEVADRCAAIAEASRGMTGNALKELIYERLAALMDRPHRQVIS